MGLDCIDSDMVEKNEDQGLVLILRLSFQVWIPIIKIRWSWDYLIFIMGIPILVRQHLFIETASIVYLITLDSRASSAMIADQFTPVSMVTTG